MKDDTMDDQPALWMGRSLQDLPPWLLERLEKRRILRIETVQLSDKWHDAL